MNFSPLTFCFFNEFHHTFPVISMDEGPHLSCFIQPISHLNPIYFLSCGGHKIIKYRLMNKKTLRRYTNLAGISKFTFDTFLGGIHRIHILTNDSGSISPHFQRQTGIGYI